MQIVPPSRPQQSQARTLALLEPFAIDLAKAPVRLLGVRGYYLDTMGVAGVNDRKMYDDAIFIIAPDEYKAYNANCDPAAHRRAIANLRAGLWLYKIGTHGYNKPAPLRYLALVQAAPVTVVRDESCTESGMFGINIHRGSRLSTSSLGCQTIWPGQWQEFIDTVRQALARHHQTRIPYALIDYDPLVHGRA